MATPDESTLLAILTRTSRAHADRAAQVTPEGPVTHRALFEEVAAAAEGLRRAGVKPGDRVGLFADNSRRWLVADLALQAVRAVSVPRGTDTPGPEMADIFHHAEVGLVFAHDVHRARALEAVRDRVPTMGEIVCLDPRDAPGATLDGLEAQGREGPSFETLASAVRPDDVATIIYTSGTTGRPKGVMLTQANFAHQVRTLPPLFRMSATEIFLSILPPWHIFERTVEYAALACGAAIAYTDRRRLKQDLVHYRPTFMASVPRLWETVYDGIHKAVRSGGALRRAIFAGAYRVAAWRAWGWDRARGHVLRVRRPHGLGILGEGALRALGLATAIVTAPLDFLAHRLVLRRVRAATGGRLRGAISGGGLMPPHIDRFFRTIGVPILVGYGLTETSPVLTVRREERNVLGTIGTAIPEVDLAIRDPETGRDLPAGAIGAVWTRGPQVMKGYTKDPALTREVLDEGGWFNTGDLGFLTEFGDLCFRGRAKETIVLSGGENVEPSHVESVLLASSLVSQVLVVGQDRKGLAALVLPECAAVARGLGLSGVPAHEALAARNDVKELLREEAVRRTASLLPFERVTRVAILPAPLDVASGCLTQTLKLRRYVIEQRYADLIDSVYTR
ncbi:MAG: long-chain fatty acid--CoA ligase [Planctomycetota bacterium]